MSLADSILGKPEDIIADRTEIERYAICPLRAWLCKRYSIQLCSKLADGGIVTHKLIEDAFEWCKEDIENISDFFTEELPKVRPDVQPDVIRAARYVADELTHMPLNKLIAVEKQIDFEYLSEKKTPKGIGAFVITTCLDLLAWGNNDALIVYDWKTGWLKRTNQDAYDSFQTQLIAFILWQMYPKVDIIHFWYKETRHGSSAYAKLERNAEHPRIPHLTTELAFSARIMEAVKLWLNNSKLAWPEPKKCSQCDAIMFCNKAHYTSRKMRCNLKRFADDMVVQEERLKHMKLIARYYIEKYGEFAGTKTVIRRKKPVDRFTLELAPSKPGSKKTKKKVEKKNGKKGS